MLEQPGRNGAKKILLLSGKCSGRGRSQILHAYAWRLREANDEARDHCPKARESHTRARL